MSNKNFSIVEGFSAVQMKYDLQEQFQRQTAGMGFNELRQFLDETLGLPQTSTESKPSDCVQQHVVTSRGR